MNILLDAHALQGPSRNRGIGRYAKNLIASLVGNEDFKWHVLISDYGQIEEFLELLRELNELFPRENIYVIPQTSFNLPVDEQKFFREHFIAALGMDALIIFDLFESARFFPISINQFSQIPTFVILYDLIPLQEPETHFLHPGSREIYNDVLENMGRCEGIFTISDYTAKTLEEFFPNLANKSFVIRGGAALQVSAPVTTKKGNVLFIGGDHPRKNTPNLVAAWQTLSAELIGSNKLIIIGDYSEASQRMLLSGLEKSKRKATNVEFLGRIDDESLSVLISSSIGLIHPAFSEGLGLPILEAIMHKVPVFCSNNTGMSEIGGAGAVIDPSSVSSIASALEKFFSDADYLNQVRESQSKISNNYSWVSAAGNLIAALNQCLLERPKEEFLTETNKLSLLVIAPGKNQRTGIARYAEQTTLGLKRFYKTTLIPTEEFENIENPLQLLKSFDRVLIHIGNSPHHNYAYGLAISFPSIIFLHESVFDGTLKIVIDEVMEITGNEVFKDSLVPTKDYRQQFLGLANGVIVHSKRARQSLISSGLSAVPFLNVPHPFLGSNVDSTSHSKNEGTYLLVSCGFLNSNKQPELIIQAVGLINSELRSKVDLEFIGDCDDTYRQKLQILAKECNVRLSISGFVDLDYLHARLKQADMAIQLRLQDSGEASGTIVDLVSFGVPTIVNDHGPFKDIPEAICIKLEAKPTANEIALVFENMLGNEQLNDISKRATAYANDFLQINHWGESVQDFIESSYKSSVLTRIVNSSRKAETASNASAAYVLELNRLVHKHVNCIFASDISNYVKTTFLTGIQRATLEIHKNLCGVLGQKDGHLVGFNNSVSTAEVESHPEILDDSVVRTANHKQPYINILLLLDLDFELANSDALQNVRRQNGFIVTLVYDVLPVMNPEWFPPGASQNIYAPWLNKILKYSDLVIVNSESVKSDLLTLPEFSMYKGEIQVIRLGSFLEKPTESVIRNLNEALVVATLEPRKGHDDLLDAFEELLQEGLEPVLHLVGRQGWMTEDLIARITGHVEFGKKLKWHVDIDDNDLKQLYSTVGVTIVPSKGEGYGLPLLEALSQNCPVISRDIPVFREFELFGVQYFDSKSASLSKKWREIILKQDDSIHLTPNYDFLPTFKDFAIRLEQLISSSLSNKSQ